MKLRLKRELGLFEATLYGIGIIIGAGIYALIGEATALAGNSVWMSFIIGAVIASFTGLSYAELSTMFPKAAAEYVYVRKASGSRFWAFLVGWLIVFTGVVSAATVALGFSGYFQAFAGPFLEKNLPIVITKVVNSDILVSMILIGVLSYINFRGMKESSTFNIIFTSIEIFGLVLIILLAIGSYGKVNYFYSPNGFKGVFSAAALIFFAFLGFEDIANIVEETKKPKKNIPYAFILAVGFTAALYALTSIATVSLVDWREISSVKNPLALVASKSFLGETGGWIISFAALFATLSTVLLILVVCSRMVYGMAREKSLPEALSLVHEKTRTPWLAVILVMVLSMVFVFFGDISLIANITSLGAFITFTAINLSLIWLRFTMPKMKRAFRVPGNIGNYPVVAFLGVFSCLFMIFQFEWKLILFGLAVIAIGAVVYELFIKRMKRFNV